MKRSLLYSLLTATFIAGVIVIANRRTDKHSTAETPLPDTIEITLAVDGKPYTQDYPLINTYGNTAGIEPSRLEENPDWHLVHPDPAALIDILSLPKEVQASLVKQYKPTSQYLIATKSGKLLTDIGFAKTDSTWSPGYLTYKNFIGVYYFSYTPALPQKIGQGAPGINFCLGSCVNKDTLPSETQE